MSYESELDLSEQRAFAYLSRVVEGPHRQLTAMIATHGVEETATRVYQRKGIPIELERSTESRWRHNTAVEDLDNARRAGYRLIAPGTKEWPISLSDAFDVVQSTQLNEGPPISLWVRGERLGGLLGEAVSIVGTRAATQYGTTVTSKLAGDLAQSGAVVVSGGALGIDAVAHRAALDVGGRTVVFAACGAGVTYPTRHAQLFDSIAESGAVVTEYPPNLRPARHRFLTRNRLVAAAGRATVLVEAGWRSGARNTAAWANRMLKPLAAVPGPITSASSTGCHDLIRNQEATLVTSADNIRALYLSVGSVDENVMLALEFPMAELQKLSHSELQVYDSLPSLGTLEAEAIAVNAGLPIGLTVHILVALSTKGLVRRDGATWRRNTGD